MRIIGVIQARMGSTRLPGKVLRRLGRSSVLARVVRAARESESLDDLVVATTTEAIDDAVVVECESLGVPVHRGPVDDVLGRFIGALATRPADAVARFTADCPLLDPEIAAQAGRVFRCLSDVDYVSTAIVPQLPLGLNVEIVRSDVLHAVDRRTAGDPASAHHRTHVTSYVWSHPDEFRVLGLTLPPNRSALRVTLDTPEDWDVIAAVVDHFGEESPPVAKLVDWLDANPAVRARNAGMVQKRVELG